MKETTKQTKDGVQKIRRKPGRVPTSCAECRRLKLRCDKQVPCEKCVSRGCASICPTGSLTPGKGNRLILANTEELHERIEHLSTRIRELEDALRTLQQTVSDEPHPLLLEPTVLLPIQPNSSSTISEHPTLSDTGNTAPAVRNMSESIAPSLSLASTPPSPPQLTQTPSLDVVDDGESETQLDASGTLVLGPDNRSRFLGNTARQEFLVEATDFPSLQPKYDFSWLPKSLLDTVFWESNITDMVLEQQIFKMLPSLSEALSLSEIYQEYGKFLYSPVSRKILFDDVLSSVYRASFSQIQNHHKLALLFIIFALAAHFDPKREPFSMKSQEYYCLARTAMKFDSGVSLLSVQVQIHIAQYLDFCEHDSMGSHLGWFFAGHAVRAGQSIGLNTDPSKWNLTPPSVQRRCHLFWQLSHLDTWASFCFGRPPLMSQQYTDCPLPADEDLDDVKSAPSFHLWSWGFTPLLQRVLATTLGSKPTKYIRVLDLDREIRDFKIPDNWRTSLENWGLLDGGHSSGYEAATTGGAGMEGTALNMQRWFVLTYKETALMNLHRAYFAQALQDMPSNLPNHPYHPSVSAIFRSAWRLLHGLQFMWKNARNLLLRTSHPWSHGISGAVVMCLFVVKVPMSRLARAALQELDSVLQLVQEAATICRPAAAFLNTITRLCRKAHEVVDRPRSRIEDDAPTVLADYELCRWAGQTQVKAAPDALEGVQNDPGLPGHHPQFPHFLATSGPSVPSTSSSSTTAPSASSMHPALAQDIRNFELGRFVHTFFDLPASQLQLQQLPPPMMVHEPGPGPASSSVGTNSNFYGPGHHSIISPPLASGPGLGVGPGSHYMGSGYEQSSPPMLDSTWQSFVEQLGF